MKESEKLRQAGVSTSLIGMMETRERIEEESGEAFVIYSEGLIFASVCSSLPDDEVKSRMAAVPSGTRNGWFFSDKERFLTGEANPCPCDQNPTTHKHYLFNC